MTQNRLIRINHALPGFNRLDELLGFFCLLVDLQNQFTVNFVGNEPKLPF